MKRSKKIYGVYNLVEWYANIKAGKAIVRVLFSGGAMTTQGVTPATFATTDPIVQLAIEHSKQFHSGKIKLLKTYPTQEDVVVERNAPKPTPSIGEHTTQPVEEPKPTEVEVPAETAVSEAAEEETEAAEVETQPQASDENVSIIKVSCHRDAAEYLRETFGVALSKLRSKSAIAAAARQYGITFDYSSEETNIED